MREKQKKYKNYIILFLCILFITTAIATYLNYIKTFKARVNVMIFLVGKETRFQSFTDSPNFSKKLEYLDRIASNNISYFTQDLERGNNFNNFTLKFKKKLSESNAINMENPNNFLKKSYRIAELHLAGFDHRLSHRFFSEWTDTRAISMNNIKNEIQKIYLETRNELYLEEEEIIKKKYLTINNFVKTFCDEKAKIMEYEVKNIYVDLIQELKNNSNLEQKNLAEKIEFIDKIISEQCLIAITKIEKESFFENVMIQNLKLAKTPSFQKITIVEKHPKKKKIQLMYENFLLSIIIFLNFLILRNLIFKLIK